MDNAWPIIRQASEDDLQSVYKLLAELGYPDLSLVEFSETYRSVLENPQMFLLVAEEQNGEVIALASLTTRPQLRLAGNFVTIDELVVSDRARGRGVGQKILNAAKATARKLGARRLELETNRARESYRRQFYVKNGFVEVDSAILRIDYKSNERSE